jgi:hypothetical protein
MAEVFTIKRDDTLPKIQVQCWDDEAKTIKTDLTLASSQVFHMMDRDQAGLGVSALKIESPAAIVGAPTDGVLEYAWDDGDGDTDQEGTFFAEFEVNWSPTSRTTFPNDGYIIIKIPDDLDATDE